MKHLDIGSIKIPATAATKSFAFLAKRGAGKTYTSAVFAEEYAELGIPFVVFDPIDVWWGLRLKADGKTKGLPVVVFGLEHADIQITRDDGVRIARAIVKENISCVISTFGMPKVAQRHLIAEFSEELLRINNTPRHIFIEEAHEFVPQRVQSGAGKCFSAVESLVVMGRNRGLGVSLINQRAATLNKDVLTQVDTLVAMRSVGPQDRKALKEWVEAHSAEGDFNDFITSLPSLPTGEAWVWSPEFMGIFKRVHIRKRHTFHPDREKLGVDFKIPTISQTDIQGFIESFSTKKKPEPVVAGVGLKKVQTPRENLLMKDNTILLASIKSETERANKWQSYAEMLEVQLDEFAKTMGLVRRNERPGKAKVSRPIPMAPVAAHKGTYAEVAESGKAMVQALEGEVKLGLCEKMIYSFLLANPNKQFTKVQLGAVTGYSHNSGGFNNALGRLTSLELIGRESGMIRLGIADESLAEPAEAYSPEIWFNGKLNKCEREIYRVLWDNPDSVYNKDELAESTVTKYSSNSGGFNNALGRLNSIGLIKRESGNISLNPELLSL